jgi:hypothetical protein
VYITRLALNEIFSPSNKIIATAISHPDNPRPFIKILRFFISSGALRHCSHAGLLYPYPALNDFRHSTPEAPERPLLAKDGTKTRE